MIVAGWGNYPRAETRMLAAFGPGDAARFAGAEASLIARGAGKAYGDAAIGADATLSLRSLDRFIAFDPERKLLTVEAGVTLAAVIDAMLPRGFFPPVVPGTMLLTIGGLVAANAHGKNHHLAGGFGNHIESLTLVQADGQSITCSATENAELFRATIGGMGLTGIITTVTLRVMAVETPFIRQELIAAPNLDALFRAFEESKDWTYTVAWTDCLAGGSARGRSIFFRGEHALVSEVDPARTMPRALELKRHALPLDFPSFTMNHLSARAFNELTWQNGRYRQGPSIIGWDKYFFPLDAIANWNRVYGRRGFVQHQFVVPKARGRDALGEVLSIMAARNAPACLAVLKLLGPDEAGMLSFPMEGYTLAVDFPATPSVLKLLDELDAVVRAYNGRLYLAKDSRQSRETFEGGYPQLNAFRDLRRAAGAASRFRSLQSDRLGI
jgi:FAD/FMN-containing dehydrogenase